MVKLVATGEGTARRGLIMNTRVVVRVKSGTLASLLDEVRAKGGRTLQAFAPDHLIAVLPPGVHLVHGEISPPHQATLDSRTAYATLASMQAREAGAPEPVLSWDTPGKKPPHLQRDAVPAASPKAIADSTGTPTSRYLIGRVGVAVVIVSRTRGTDPVAPAEYITPTERANVASEAAAGLGWLALEEPRAGVEFVFSITELEVDVTPDGATPDTYEDRERVWRDPALAKMGYAAGQAGYAKLARDVRDAHGARWGYVIFVTKYPLHHFAYASVERLVVDYNNDGWGPSQLDRVIAHESCHIFGALDEYASSNCNCTDRSGELNVENGNCRSCATNFVPCLMEANTFAVCNFTRGQIGWRSPLLASRAQSAKVASNQDGRLEVFYIGMDDVLYHTWQLSPGAGWGGEYALGAPTNKAKQIAVGRNADGRLEVFYIGTDDVLYHTWQTSPNGAWSGENRLGTATNKAKQICVAQNADGRLEVFYIGTDDVLYHTWQTTPSGGWSGENRLGTATNKAKQICVEKNADGRLEAFYVGTDDVLYHTWQTTPNGAWSGENRLGSATNRAKQICAERNADGRLEVFYIGTDDVLYHTWQTAPGGAWSGENRLGTPTNKGKRISVTRNQDGRLEAFYVGTNDVLYHTWQTAPNGAWSGENALGAPTNKGKELSTGRNRDGRLEAIYVGTDNIVYHTWQTAPGGAWSGESAL